MLNRRRRLVAISDFCDGEPFDRGLSVEQSRSAWLDGTRLPRPDVERPSPGVPDVVGGYLERLPLAAIRQNLCDEAEIWSFWGHGGEPPFSRDGDFLARRSFHADARAPFSSTDMLGHIAAFGAPEILCVWGLGVDEAILRACENSVKIYNSIDAPALRVAPEISRHFDLVITGAEWQSREVAERHPGMATIILPIGPEFASPETFFPLGSEKVYDLIYVAAAQGYKRHDLMFDAMAKLPRSLRALCVFGYGELAGALRQRAADLGIAVDFVGPPGVPFGEVNRLMNSARIGVVCGVDDGAPAIITEYMLAGLPVLANAGLRCGLQYINPRTGFAAPEDRFHEAILEMLSRLGDFAPRQEVLDRWTWPHSIEKLETALFGAVQKKLAAAGNSVARR